MTSWGALGWRGDSGPAPALLCVAEAAVHHPRAGAVLAVPQLGWSALHRYRGLLGLWGAQAGAQLELLGTGRAVGAYKESIFLLPSGKKQDTWFIVDPKSGEKQTTLSTEAWDGLCPSSPLLYIGRTRKPVLCPHRPPGARNGALEVTLCPAPVPRVRYHHV